MRNPKLEKMKTPTSCTVRKSFGVVVLMVLWMMFGREGSEFAAFASSSSLSISSPPSCNIVTIFGLKTADCNAVGLRSIPKTLDRDLRVFKFTENLLSSLKTDDFQPYVYLQEIYLVRNVLEAIFPNAFRGLYSLQILDLEGNKLASIRAYFFLGIASVRILSLRSNPIQNIESNAFSTLVNLEELSLENCWLNRVDPLLLKGLEKLIEINLVNNELKGFAAEMETHLPRSLRVFRLWKNHWQCDCHLRWFRQWLITSLVNWDFPHNTPTCAGPEILNGVQWKHLTANQFACPSKILINSSTSIEVLPGSNVTVDCVVIGDPEPSVFWMKDSHAVDKQYVSQRRFKSQTNELSIRSSILLPIVTPNDAGDYKCVAENPAGRSEVTFKLWVEQQRSAVAPDTADTDDNQQLSAKQEIFLGVAIGGTLLLVGLVICVVCMVRRTEVNKNPLYRGRGDRESQRGDKITDNGSAVKTAERLCEDDDEDSAKEDVLVDADKCLSSTLKSLLAGKSVSREKDPTACSQLEPIDPNARFLTVESTDTSGQNPNKSISAAAGASGLVEFGGELLRAHGATERESAVQGIGGGQVLAKSLTKETNSLKDKTPDLLSYDSRALTDQRATIALSRNAKATKVSFAVGESGDFARTPSLKRAQENPYAKFSDLHHHHGGSAVKCPLHCHDELYGVGGGAGTAAESPNKSNETGESFKCCYPSNDPQESSVIDWTDDRHPRTRAPEASSDQDGPSLTTYYCSAADTSSSSKDLVPVASCPSLLPKISFADTSYRPTSRARVKLDAQSKKPTGKHQADVHWTTEFGVLLPHPVHQHSSSPERTNVLHKSRSHGTLHARPTAPPTQCRFSSFSKTLRYQKCPTTTTIALPASIVGITEGLFPVPPSSKPAAEIVHSHEDFARRSGRRDAAKDKGEGDTTDCVAYLPTKSDSTLKRKQTKPHDNLGTTV